MYVCVVCQIDPFGELNLISWGRTLFWFQNYNKIDVNPILIQKNLKLSPKYFDRNLLPDRTTRLYVTVCFQLLRLPTRSLDVKHPQRFIVAGV